MACATAKNDTRLLTLIGNTADCVAREVRYHRSCYKTYTRKATGGEKTE